ncbi:V/A-type H+-transporting ATPase subunit C [Anaerotaenia torta]|uniref:V0D/AC39 family V-type ATPase subunit n=1 Tax=Anaerotaenia torta TaxID=433293 RepID=UPI003D1BFAAB
MDSAISYSGINTKVKAMHSKLISKADYEKITNLETVADFVAFLKRHPGYAEFLRHYDERQVHRGEAERVLFNTLFIDYAKIYRFANDIQRQDLELVFFRYEINVLKTCIRLIHSSEKVYDLSAFQQFFSRHSQINAALLSSSRSIDEYIQNLKGTQYYKLLSKLNAKPDLTSFDYEMTLDVYYFTRSWKLKDSLLRGKNRTAFTQRMGTEIDLLNIMWIYRSKKMYDMNSAQIFTYLIPVNYKLSISQLSRLVQAATTEEFLNALQTTRYKFFIPFLKDGSMEREYSRIIDKIYLVNIARYPASMTQVNYYLFCKGMEIQRLTSALECIRYGLDLKKKQEYILY